MYQKQETQQKSNHPTGRKSFFTFNFKSVAIAKSLVDLVESLSCLSFSGFNSAWCRVFDWLAGLRGFSLVTVIQMMERLFQRGRKFGSVS